MAHAQEQDDTTRWYQHGPQGRETTGSGEREPDLVPEAQDADWLACQEGSGRTFC